MSKLDNIVTHLPYCSAKQAIDEIAKLSGWDEILEYVVSQIRQKNYVCQHNKFISDCEICKNDPGISIWEVK